MLGRSGMMTRNIIRSNLRYHSEDREAIPIGLKNRYRLTAVFVISIGIGVAAPFFVLRFLLLKRFNPE